jgi:hypothetical protein
MAEAAENYEKYEFEFDELSKEAQKDAIEQERNTDGYIDYEWWDSTYDMLMEDLKDSGYKNVKIWFSGFWSQGDGACFDGEIDAEIFIKKWIKDFWPLSWIMKWADFGFYIKQNNHHYSHKYTRYIDHESRDDIMDAAEGELKPFQYNILMALGGNDYLEKMIENLAFSIDEDRKDWCDKIYKSLEEEYDYLMSDEAIKEHFEANDAKFNEDGERIY